MCHGVKPECMRQSEMQLWFPCREGGPSSHLLSPTVCQALMAVLHTPFHIITTLIILSTPSPLLSLSECSFCTRAQVEIQTHQRQLDEQVTHAKGSAGVQEGDGAGTSQA